MMNKKIKTLIVDDNAFFRETAKMFLEEQEKIELIGCVNSGSECLNFVDKNPPDLILMDARMSGLDGPQTTQKLKEKYPNIKVTICTIWAEKEAHNYAIQSGADDFFVKGNPLSALLQKIYALFP
jgi:DNA-binding NarL/FixJ family response regulator